MHTIHRWTLVAVSAIGMTFCGCSKEGLKKTVVQGTVTYDGEPIPHGQIRFIPIDATKGPISGGVIKDGQYVADGKGGVPVGEHRVEIYAYRPVSHGVSSAVRAEGGSSEQYLPGKYNGRSELTAAITADSGSQSLDFDLEP